MNLQEKIFFKKAVPNSEIYKYYQDADLFALAMRTDLESLPIPVLEAMASGKPIVASNISGYATVVSHGVDGLLTTPRNSEELAWAVEHLLGHEPLRQQFIQAGLHKAREYAWPRVAESVLEFYYELLDKQGIGLLRQRSRA